MALTLTSLISEFGAYYLNSGQNRNRLISALMQPTETLSVPGINHIKTDDTIYQLANPIFGSVLQGFQKAFTDKGDIDFHPNQIQLRHMKVDKGIYPHDIEESWLGFLGGDSSRTLRDWPIVRYILEAFLAPQVIEDKETQVVYGGEYSAPTPGTPGNASAVMDGLKKQLLKGAADTYPINIIDGIGAMDTSDAFGQIEDMAATIAHKYAKLPLVFFVAPEVEMAYLRLKRNAGYYDIKSDTEIGTRIDFTPFTLKGVASMSGTTDCFATLPKNILHLTKRDFSTASMDCQVDDRQVKFLIDWFEAVGFACNAFVWATRETVASASVATPTFSGTSSITISCATAGATIRYTTDGSEPTSSSTQYSAAITGQASGTVIKAKAFKTGLAPSATATKIIA